MVKNHRIKLHGFSASLLMLSYFSETLRSEAMKNSVCWKKPGKKNPNNTITTQCNVLNTFFSDLDFVLTLKTGFQVIEILVVLLIFIARDISVGLSKDR